MANNTGFFFISLLEDINNINDIDTIIDEISYAIYHKIALRIGVSTIYINHVALHQALLRYSKDVYGFARTKKEIAKYIKDNNILDSIMYNIKYSAGFMLETDKPHINKKIAYLCYHLSCLKPFSASKMDANFYQDVEQMDYIENHFNEVIIYFIIIIILSSGKSNLNISDENKKHLIHSLRYRKLNRSSLELVFENIIPKYKLY